jgi:glycosyltransferase involved in cell wall biosynthesis
MGHAQRISLLHLITTLDVGGAEMMLLKLVSRLDVSRFRNHVVCLAEDGPVGEKISAHGIPVHALNMPRGRVTIEGLTQLFRHVRKIKPAILQTWMYHADLIGVLLGKLSRIPRICWNIRCSNMDLLEYRWTTRITVRMCALLSVFPDLVIANSRQGLNYHREIGYKSRRWKVIPNGFDLGEFKPDPQAKLGLMKELGLGYKNSSLLIGYVARFDPMKDHATFLDAACLLLKERRDVHFVMVGRGIEWENRGLTARIPKTFSDNFHLLGERSDVEKITAGLDIACSVSAGEGFSNVIGEAMACEIPCVVTDVGDSALIVGETGLVVKPQDSEGLAGAWRKLLDLGGDGRSELGRGARKRIQDHFDISKIVEQYEALYCFLLNERKRG